MKALLISIFGLTLVDVGCTYFGYKAGYIEEANPLLRYMFHSHPELTSILVIIFVGFLLSLLWEYKEKVKYIALVVAGLLTIKIAVAALHLGWLLKI